MRNAHSNLTPQSRQKSERKLCIGYLPFAIWSSCMWFPASFEVDGRKKLCRGMMLTRQETKFPSFSSTLKRDYCEPIIAQSSSPPNSILPHPRDIIVGTISHFRQNSNHPYSSLPPWPILLSFTSQSCSRRPFWPQSPAAFISITQPSSILAPKPPGWPNASLHSIMVILLSLIQASASQKQLLTMTALPPVPTSRNWNKSSTLLCCSSPLSKA